MVLSAAAGMSVCTVSGQYVWINEATFSSQKEKQKKEIWLLYWLAKVASLHFSGKMNERMNLAEALQITMQCHDGRLMNSEIHEFQLIYAEKATLCRSQSPSILVSCLQLWPELCQRSHNPKTLMWPSAVMESQCEIWTQHHQKWVWILENKALILSKKKISTFSKVLFIVIYRRKTLI